MTGTSSARSSELAQLLDDGRAAYLAIDDEHDGAPIAGSPIHADWATLSNLNGEPWPLWLRHFASVSARLLASAAAEYMAGLATLYRGSAQPLTLAHFPVTRAVVESLGQSYWILRPGINAKAQTGDQFARARAARAYLTLCASEFQRVSVEEERSGEGSPAHQSAKSRLEELKNDASKYFESVQLGTRTNQWKIEEQSRPTFTGFSKDLMHLAFQEEDGRIKNPYAPLSGISHANLFAIVELMERVDDDHIRHVFKFDQDDADAVAAFACQTFAIGTEVVTSAHDWDDQPMVEWYKRVRDVFGPLDAR